MGYDSVAKAIPELSYEEQVSLMELLMASIKKALVNRNNETENKTDYTDSYPKGYFDLFGSIDDPTFVEPTELPIELDKMESL